MKASGAKDERDQLLGGGGEERDRGRGGVNSGFSGLGVLMTGWEDHQEEGEDGSKHIRKGQSFRVGLPA